MLHRKSANTMLLAKMQIRMTLHKTYYRIVLENVPHIRKKTLINDNRCFYQMTQKELKTRNADIYKIIHNELQGKKSSVVTPPPTI